MEPTPEAQDSFTPIEFSDEAVTDDAIGKADDWRPSIIQALSPDPVTLGLLVLGGGMVLGAGFVRMAVSPATTATSAIIMVGMLIIAATAYLRPLSATVASYSIPALNRPPTIERSHSIERHGVVKCGQTDILRTDGTTRPYQWIWIEEAAENDRGRTGEYRWYQYVNPVFTIDNKAWLSGTSFEASTGLTYTYGQWNAHYHISDVRPSDPEFQPHGLNLNPNNPGKPYTQYPVPQAIIADGTGNLKRILNAAVRTPARVTGILDAPDFFLRTGKGEERLSQVEQDVRRLIPRHQRTRASRHCPPDQDVAVQVSADIRSYLVCIREGQVHCVGYVSWNYTTDITLRLVWSTSGPVDSGTIPTWIIGSEAVRCGYNLTVGDWTMPCE